MSSILIIKIMDVLPMIAYMKNDGTPVNIYKIFLRKRNTGIPMQNEANKTRKPAIKLSVENFELDFFICGITRPERSKSKAGAGCCFISENRS